jgi:hypothetical protein
MSRVFQPRIVIIKQTQQNVQRGKKYIQEVNVRDSNNVNRDAVQMHYYTHDSNLMHHHYTNGVQQIISK